MYSLHDPLLEFETSRITHTSSSRALIRSIRRTLKFLAIYIALSGSIFLILLGLLNYNAYASRFISWIDPTWLESARIEFGSVIASSSVEVHASEGDTAERLEDIETITEKIINADPSMVYSKSYNARGLIAGLGNVAHKATFDILPYENRIIIPRIGENIPLIDSTITEGSSFETMHEIFMEDLKSGVVRYPGTARPGETGNVFIFGHSSNYPWIKSKYNAVFALLDKLKNGDEIIIYYEQKKYTYKVTDRAIVKPGDIKTLESRDKNKKELTLMTCWPIGTTLERILIFAELVEEK